MLFHVRIDVAIPRDLPSAERAQLIAAEKARALELQEKGVWPHLWRVAGQYSSISVLDVESNDALHELLWSLPLYPFMQVEVTPLAQHPSALAARA